MLEWGRKIVAVEVKLTGSPSYSDCEGLEAFLKDHPETSAGILVHTGRKVARMGTKIIALPWMMLAGLQVSRSLTKDGLEWPYNREVQTSPFRLVHGDGVRVFLVVVDAEMYHGVGSPVN